MVAGLATLVPGTAQSGKKEEEASLNSGWTKELSHVPKSTREFLWLASPSILHPKGVLQPPRPC